MNPIETRKSTHEIPASGEPIEIVPDWRVSVLRSEAEDPAAKEAAFSSIVGEFGGQLTGYAIKDEVRTPEQFDALLLGAAGFSYEEIAELHGASVGAIKLRIYRARQAARRSVDHS